MELHSVYISQCYRRYEGAAVGRSRNDARFFSDCKVIAMHKVKVRPVSDIMKEWGFSDLPGLIPAYMGDARHRRFGH